MYFVMLSAAKHLSQILRYVQNDTNISTVVFSETTVFIYAGIIISL